MNNQLINALRALLLMAILFTVGFVSRAAVKKDSAGSFKTIGYLMLDRDDMQSVLSAIDFSKLTHINLAFINPGASGAFNDMPTIPQIVTLAHSKGVKVLMSVGGGNIPAWLTGLLADDKRPAFVQAIAAMVSKYNLDGVDIDLEGPAITKNYLPFVADIAALLKPQYKLLTAALATPYGPAVPDKVLPLFDFINIMSYDKTGPWRPSDAGQHAPYDMAVSDLDYWENTRGVAKEKLTLGVPFYGYGFGPKNTTSDMGYGTIVSTYPGAEMKDQVLLPDGEKMYYNGIPTITQKTTLALQRAGGIMIWEITQDATGTFSLLKTINDKITGK